MNERERRLAQAAAEAEQDRGQRALAYLVTHYGTSEQWGPLVAELERLQRIEGLARDRQAAMDAVRNRGGQKNSDWLVRAEAALRAALVTDGAET